VQPVRTAVKVKEGTLDSAKTRGKAGNGIETASLILSSLRGKGGEKGKSLVRRQGGGPDCKPLSTVVEYSGRKRRGGEPSDNNSKNCVTSPIKKKKGSATARKREGVTRWGEGG